MVQNTNTTSSYTYSSFGGTILDEYYSIDQSTSKYSLPLAAVEDLMKVLNGNRGKELSVMSDEVKLKVDGKKKKFVHLVVKYNNNISILSGPSDT